MEFYILTLDEIHRYYSFANASILHSADNSSLVRFAAENSAVVYQDRVNCFGSSSLEMYSGGVYKPVRDSAGTGIALCKGCIERRLSAAAALAAAVTSDPTITFQDMSDIIYSF